MAEQFAMLILTEKEKELEKLHLFIPSSAASNNAYLYYSLGSSSDGPPFKGAASKHRPNLP